MQTYLGTHEITVISPANVQAIFMHMKRGPVTGSGVPATLDLAKSVNVKNHAGARKDRRQSGRYASPDGYTLLLGATDVNPIAGAV